MWELFSQTEGFAVGVFRIPGKVNLASIAFSPKLRKFGKTSVIDRLSRLRIRFSLRRLSFRPFFEFISVGRFWYSDVNEGYRGGTLLAHHPVVSLIADRHDFTAGIDRIDQAFRWSRYASQYGVVMQGGS